MVKRRGEVFLFTLKDIWITESGISLNKSRKEATFLIEMATQRIPLPRENISGIQNKIVLGHATVLALFQ